MICVQKSLAIFFIEGRNCREILRYRKDFRTSHFKSVYHGTESIAYLGLKIWNIAPDEIKKKPISKPILAGSAKFLWVELVLLKVIKTMICQLMKSLLYVNRNDTSNIYIILV